MERTVVRLPSLRATFRHAARNVFEGTIAPLAIFYVGLRFLGLTGAVLLGLGWSLGAVAVRLIQRQPVPGILVLTTLLFVTRAGVSLATGSVFVYFLQPTLGTLLVAGAFLVSVPLRRPLARRLANDFLPLPESIRTAPWLETFFLRISLLWAGVFLVNGALSLWLLVSQSVGTFMVARTAVSTGLTVAAIAGSTLGFVVMARKHHVHVAVR